LAGNFRGAASEFPLDRDHSKHGASSAKWPSRWVTGRARLQPCHHARSGAGFSPWGWPFRWTR